MLDKIIVLTCAHCHPLKDNDILVISNLHEPNEFSMLAYLIYKLRLQSSHIPQVLNNKLIIFMLASFLRNEHNQPNNHEINPSNCEEQ